MPLSKDKLKTYLSGNITDALNPLKDVKRILAADNIAKSYDTYAKQAVDTSANSPTLTKGTVLKNLLRVSNAKNPLLFADPALEWANAFSAYWAGALFGGVAALVPLSATAQLSADLQVMWDPSTMPSTLALASGGLADHLHKFTTAINVGGSPIL